MKSIKPISSSINLVHCTFISVWNIEVIDPNFTNIRQKVFHVDNVSFQDDNDHDDTHSCNMYNLSTFIL